MVIRQAPGTGIDVETRIEAALLGEAAQLGIAVAAAQRPVATAGAGVVLQHLNLVAGVAQLVGGHEARNTRAEHEHRSALRRGAQLDRPVEIGFGREAETVHRLVHRRAARAQSDHREQLTPRNRFARSFIHAIPFVL